MERRYKALRIIGTVYKVLGSIVGVLTILGLLATCAASVMGGALIDELSQELYNNSFFPGILGGVVGGLMISVLLVMYGGGLAVTLYALGEGVYLILSIEENTRATAAMLAKQANPPPPPYLPPLPPTE